jgi:pyruvate dehydrogenase E2 component (dihydrolipoamide acetyltransferase)
VILPDFTGVSFEDKEVSNIRKVIAERLCYSKQNIPHYYVTVAVNVDNLIKLRGKLNTVAKSKISVNDMVIKAASLASVRVPETNSSWTGEAIRQFKNVNMCVAVQTDFGLMAPVITNTHLKGLDEIAAEVKDIAARARENKLKPDELSGGTFTISNLGMFGVHNFSAIINPPQACILAVSAAEKRVVVDEQAAKDSVNPYKVAHVMNVTLSSDHRVVDGAVAAQWGLEFKKFIENPEYMLL